MLKGSKVSPKWYEGVRTKEALPQGHANHILLRLSLATLEYKMVEILNSISEKSLWSIPMAFCQVAP